MSLLIRPFLWQLVRIITKSPSRRYKFSINFILTFADIFNKYIELRHADQQRIIKLTNSIASSFYNTSLLSASLANTIMLLLDFIPEFRSLFLKRAMGLAGYQPRLVRGLQL